MTPGPLPDCPYCGGPSELVHVDQGDDVDFLECLVCLSEFAREPSGALVYVLDYGDEPPG